MSDWNSVAAPACLRYTISYPLLGDVAPIPHEFFIGLTHPNLALPTDEGQGINAFAQLKMDRPGRVLEVKVYYLWRFCQDVQALFFWVRRPA